MPLSDLGPSGGFAMHEAKSGEQGEGQSLREKLSRDRPGSNSCGFCGGDGRTPYSRRLVQWVPWMLSQAGLGRCLGRGTLRILWC